MSLCYMHTIHNQQSDQHEVNIFTKLVCILKSKYEKNQMTSHTRNFMPFKVEGDKVDHELNLNPQLWQSSWDVMQLFTFVVLDSVNSPGAKFSA